MTAKEFITVDNLECMFSDATYGVDYFTIEIPEGSKQLANTIRKMQPDICRETLWAEIVVKGANLTVIDNEDDKKYTINRHNNRTICTLPGARPTSLCRFLRRNM